MENWVPAQPSAVGKITPKPGSRMRSWRSSRRSCSAWRRRRGAFEGLPGLQKGGAERISWGGPTWKKTSKWWRKFFFFLGGSNLRKTPASWVKMNRPQNVNLGFINSGVTLASASIYLHSGFPKDLPKTWRRVSCLGSSGPVVTEYSTPSVVQRHPSPQVVFPKKGSLFFPRATEQLSPSLFVEGFWVKCGESWLLEWTMPQKRTDWLVRGQHWVLHQPCTAMKLPLRNQVFQEFPVGFRDCCGEESGGLRWTKSASSVYLWVVS